jgi:hypothetical protein
VLGATTVLTFTSDRSNVGRGFSLEYFGFGPREQGVNTEYTNFHTTETEGSLTFPGDGSPGQEYYDSLTQVIVPVPGHALSLTITEVDIGSLYSGCDYNYLSIHQLFSQSFELRLR